MSSSNDHDTDPSTPEAISSRSSALAVQQRSAPAQPAPSEDVPPAYRPPIEPARIVALPGASSSVMGRDQKAEQQTEPGVAPPSVPPPNFNTGSFNKNTSVDTLLHGIGDGTQDRVRVAPQSAGEAVATYHAQHSLRAGQQTVPPEPSVVVARLPMTPTVRVTRNEGDSVRDVNVPRPPRAPDPTIEIPTKPSNGPKVVTALFLAIAVVFILAIVLKRRAIEQKAEAIKADPTASAFVIPPPPSKPAPVRDVQAQPASAVPVAPPVSTELLPLPVKPADAPPVRALLPPPAAPTAVAPLAPAAAASARPARPAPTASGTPMHRAELIE